MKIITWNIRGLNSSHKLDMVRNLVREHKLAILLLQETKMEKERAKKIKSFNDYCIKASSSEGASRCTMVLWKKTYFSGTILNGSKNFMVEKITSIDQNKFWYIINMYAPNLKNSRKKVWDSLSIIKSKDYFGRWIFLGDFNVNLYDHEKNGRNVC